MNWKLALVALFALLLAGLLYYGWNSPAETTDPGALALESHANPALADEEPPPAQPQLPLATGLRAEVEQAPVATPAKPVATQVYGTVVVTNEAGAELTRSSGEMTLVLWKGNSGSHAKVPITTGTFEVDALDAESLSVYSLVLDGRGAVPDESGRRYVPTEVPLVVRAHWPQSVRLNVLSAATGEHLTGITIQRGESAIFGFMEDREHPGRIDPRRTQLTHGQSPLELHPSTQDARSSNVLYFLHSPGFAWKALYLNPTQGGEREVRLEPGGDVEFLLEGEVPRSEGQLRLRAEGWTDPAPFAEVPLGAKGSIELTGLPPGAYLATIEVGSWYSEPVPLAKTTIEVRAGERTQARLFVTAAPAVTFARLAGTLLVPTSWGIPDFTLQASPEDPLPDGSRGRFRLGAKDMTRRAPEGGTWDFEFLRIPVGTYQLQLEPTPGSIRFERALELPPQGRADVLFEVPAPGLVVVHLLDAGTGAPAAVESLSWSRATGPHGNLRSSGSARRDPDHAGFEFLAPLGELSLRTYADDYASLSEKVPVVPGRNEFTFRLDPPCSVHFVLMDGKTEVPFGAFWYPTPEHLDGEGEMQGATMANGQTFFSLSRPGRYVFEMPAIPGFQPIPPQTVTVEPGKRTEHVVQLSRED